MKSSLFVFFLSKAWILNSVFCVGIPPKKGSPQNIYSVLSKTVSLFPHPSAGGDGPSASILLRSADMYIISHHNTVTPFSGVQYKQTSVLQTSRQHGWSVTPLVCSWHACACMLWRLTAPNQHIQHYIYSISTYWSASEGLWATPQGHV